MEKLIEKLSLYHTYHTRKATQLTHLFGVPAVTSAFLILFSWIHIHIPGILNISIIWPIVILTLGYYFLLDLKFGIAMTAVCLPLALLAYWIAYPSPNAFNITIFLILFIGGWTLQLVGHYLEGKRPSFLSNFSHVLIAPLFVASEIAFILGYRKELKIKIVELVSKRSQSYL